MSVAIAVPLTINGENPFDERVEAEWGGPLCAQAIDTIQVNIGLTCDLACRHCHVESSPQRTEQMDWPTMELVLDAASKARVTTIDITGGAPEMNPHFRRFVTAIRSRGIDVLVRTNLTTLLRDGFEGFPRFYRENRVHLVASLPCYLPDNVNKQRGLHVYDKSVEAIQRLNELGYGVEPELPLDLVYNPLGPSLPPDQQALEQDYRRELDDRFGIKFTRLLTITNVPIGRFLHDLRRDNRDAEYASMLDEAFNSSTVAELMCRRQVHVSWDGTLHDCDFNYALGLSTTPEQPRHIRDFDPRTLANRRIATGAHCFACTAGHGSSCGGALA